MLAPLLALATLAPQRGKDDATTKAERLFRGLEIEWPWVESDPSLVRAVAIRLLREVPEIERDGELLGQTHSRGYTKLRPDSTR